MLRFSAEGSEHATAELPSKKKSKSQKKKSKVLGAGKKSKTEVSKAELDLAEELFGKPQDLFLQQPNKEDDDEVDGASLFTIDKSSGDPGSKSVLKEGKAHSATEAAAAATVAWVDEDDDDLEDVNLAQVPRLKKLRASAAPEDASVSGSVLEERLRRRFLASQAEHNASWAKLPTSKKQKKRARGLGEVEDSEDGSDGSEDDDESLLGADVLRSTAPLKRGGARGGLLGSGELDIIRCKDANAVEPSRSVVRSVAFHPKGELLLTAGMDKTLRFFHVDGKKNEKVDGVFFDDLPIYSADWSHGGDKVTVSGRRPFFYMYDCLSGTASKVRPHWSSSSSAGKQSNEEKSLERLVVSGDGLASAFTLKHGWCGVVDNRSQRVRGEVKMNGTSRSVSFTPDGNCLVTSGGDADVYVWDLRKTGGGGGCGGGGGGLVKKFQNEGGMPTCGLACSPSYNTEAGAAAAAGGGGSGVGGMLAVASESGVVNMYSGSGGGAGLGAGSPWKSLLNLTTPVETMKFNHDGQILAMASRWTKNALRLVHVESGTVFSNWPTSKSPINYVFSLDFSPTSGFLALGNDKGRVLLYRLRHYNHA